MQNSPVEGLKERPRSTGEFCPGGGFFPLLRFLSFPGKKGNEERQEFCGKTPRVIYHKKSHAALCVS